MTTKEAFSALLNGENDLNPSTVRSLKKRLRDGKLLSLDKMEQILSLHGWKKVPESWKKPFEKK